MQGSLQLGSVLYFQIPPVLTLINSVIQQNWNIHNFPKYHTLYLSVPFFQSWSVLVNPTQGWQDSPFHKVFQIWLEGPLWRQIISSSSYYDRPCLPICPAANQVEDVHTLYMDPVPGVLASSLIFSPIIHSPINLQNYLLLFIQQLYLGITDT